MKLSIEGWRNRQANRLGRIVRDAFARRAASSDADGTSASSHARDTSRFLLAFAIGLLALLVLASAAQASKSVLSYYGNRGTLGGQFREPEGVAVNTSGNGTGASAGDVYVADSSNNRIEQFHADGEFVRAFGQGVVSSAASGVGTLGGGEIISPFLVSSGAFLEGQTLSGSGIPAGTAIKASGIEASLSRLQLSNPAPASLGDVPLSVAADPGNVPTNELQAVSVRAVAGKFKLTATLAQGGGRHTAGSSEILGLSASLGAFLPGQEISGAGIPAATTVLAVNPAAHTLTLSKNANASGGGLLTAKATTAELEYSASAAEVKSALEALPGLSGSVAVTGGPGDQYGTPPYRVEFKGALYGDVNVAQMSATSGATPLSGGSPSSGATVTTLRDGANGYEVCATAGACRAGLTSTVEAKNPGGELSEPQGIAIDQASGNLYVTNQGLKRVDEFEANGTFVRAFGRDVVAPAAEGEGTLTSGSPEVTGLTASFGAFAANQPITGTGIPPGTKISIVAPGEGKLFLSKPATAAGSQALTAITPASNSANEVQAVRVSATAGKFTLEFDGETTSELEHGAGHATVEGALNALPSISTGGGSVEVSGGPGDETGENPYVVTFNGGPLAGTNVPQMNGTSGPGTPLSGGSPSSGVTVTTTNNGATGFEVCEHAAYCKAGAEGSTAGAFGYAYYTGQLAIAPAGSPNAGDVLVADPGNRRVQEFKPNGEFVRAFGWDVVESGSDNTAANEFEICKAAVDVCKEGASGSGTGQFGGGTYSSGPTRVAEDPAGDVYTVESHENFRVQKFMPSGSSLTPAIFGGPGEPNGTSESNAPTDVAIGASEHVFVVKAFEEEVTPSCPYTGSASVAERRVQELSSAGTLLDTHMACAAIESVNGLAVNPNATGAGHGRLYLSSTTGGERVYVLDNVSLPVAVIEAPGNLTATGATFKGEVNPEGSLTNYRFEYSEDGGTTWKCLVNSNCANAKNLISAGSGSSLVKVSAPVALKPDTVYKVRLKAIKPFEAGTATSTEESFSTPAAAPTVISGYAAPRTTTTARLTGLVNPNGHATQAHFEYGSAGPCSAHPCETTTPESAGTSYIEPGQPYASLVANLENLKPATTYWYRLLADNSGGGGPGSAAGADRSFTTLPLEPAPGNCPNEVVRQKQHTEYLPDCRGVELVNQPEKGNRNVRPRGNIEADISAGGERAIWAVEGGAPGSYTFNSTFLARRTGPSEAAPSGWTSLGLAPPPAEQVGNGAFEYAAKFVPNLASADFSRVFLEAVAPVGGEKVAVRLDLTPQGGLEQHLLRSYPHGGAYNGDDLSADGSHLLAVNEEAHQLEDIGSGTPEVLSIMPDGAQSQCGLNETALGVERLGYHRIDTADASRVYFSALRNGSTCEWRRGLYLRNRETGLTSLIDPGIMTSGAQREPVFIRATPDGRHAFFLSNGNHSTWAGLDPEERDPTKGEGGWDVYRFDEASGTSVCLTCQMEDEAGEKVGSAGIFEANARPVPVLVSDDGSHVYFQSQKQLIPGYGTEGAGHYNLYALSHGIVRFVAEPNNEEGASLQEFRGARLSADGNVLVFGAPPGLTADQVASLPHPNTEGELYRYDDADQSLECVSCRHGGLTTNAVGNDSLSSDGSTLVFTTREALLPSDVNNGMDVYEWRDGALHLLTDGRTSFATSTTAALQVWGMSAGGRDVFFSLADPDLTGFEADGQSNLYDAREGGGFPPPTPPAHCTEDSCQGPLQPAPGEEQPASGNESAGNVKEAAPKPRCPKGKVRRRGRCLKPKHKRRHHHRRARAAHRNQGGSK